VRTLRFARSATLAGVFWLSPLVYSQEGVVPLRNLTIETATFIAQGALQECRAKGFHTAVAVVDRNGQLLVVMRDEQAVPQTTEMARRKAYTATLFRITTLEFAKRTQAETARAPQRDVADVLALGGGAPVVSRGEILGGIASSGSSPEQDDACAQAGLTKAANLLK